VLHPPLPTSSPIGLNVHTFSDVTNPEYDATGAQVAELIRKANVGWVRIDVRWDMVQTNLTDNLRTDPSTWNWSGLDATMNRAYCAGLNVMGILQGTPTWASPVDGPSAWKYNATDLSDWTRFVQASVDRYPWVRYWSIWNEPNEPSSYLQSADDYAQLVATAAPAIRENYDAQGRRYLAAPEVAQDSANMAAWTARVLTLQGDNVDIVTLHSYGDADNHVVSVFRGATGVPAWHWDIWLTETNVTGCNDSDDNYRNSHTTCVNSQGTRSGSMASWIYIDDGAQSSFLTTQYNNLASGTVDPYWKKLFYYDSHSEPNQAIDTASKPNDYGVIGGWLDHGLYAKSAYYALGRAAGLNPIASVSGPDEVYSDDSPLYSVGVVGGHSDPYYYEWHYICKARTPSADCDGSVRTLAEGWDRRTVSLHSHRADGTATLYVYIRDTALDSPVTAAYAATDGIKISLYSTPR
jgi:hypothetical protein